jgi:RNA:NAD 2'-phosphotransferase (TPT1/KptA family)
MAVDVRERGNDQEESIRLGTERERRTMWTALPAIVKEDSKGHHVRLRPAIKGWLRNAQGQSEPVEISYLGDVPIQFVRGGEFVITHPVKEKDEGIVIFSTRCIDSWYTQGGVQGEPYMRQHHLSDGMYVPGICSVPRSLGDSGQDDQQQQQSTQRINGVEEVNIIQTDDSGGQQQQGVGRSPSTTTIHIRTEAGDHYIELTGTQQQSQAAPLAGSDKQAHEGRPGPHVNIVAVHCNIKADLVHMDTPKLEVTGDIIAKGEVTAKGDVQPSQDYGQSAQSFQNRDAARLASIVPLSGSEVHLSTHKHSDVQSGQGQTGAPVPGT